MKYLKLFEEMVIEGEFPYGHELSTREKKILADITDLGEKFLKKFNIKVDDHYYYTNYGSYCNRFDDFTELKDYILLWYYLQSNKPGEYLELLKTSKLDPSFDKGYSICWASSEGHIEIVKHLLNDPRVDPYYLNGTSIGLALSRGHKEVVRLLLNDKRVRDKLSDSQINKYINEIS